MTNAQDFQYTPEQVVEEVKSITGLELNAAGITIYSLKECDGTQLVVASYQNDQPMVELEAIIAHLNAATAKHEASGDPDAVYAKNMVTFDMYFYGSVIDPTAGRVKGQIAFVLGEGADDMAKALRFAQQDPLSHLLARIGSSLVASGIPAEVVAAEMAELMSGE